MVWWIDYDWRPSSLSPSWQLLYNKVASQPAPAPSAFYIVRYIQDYGKRKYTFAFLFTTSNGKCSLYFYTAIVQFVWPSVCTFYSFIFSSSLVLGGFDDETPAYIQYRVQPYILIAFRLYNIYFFLPSSLYSWTQRLSTHTHIHKTKRKEKKVFPLYSIVF